MEETERGENRGAARTALFAATAGLIIVSLLLQFSWFRFMTSDYTYFVNVWFDTLLTHHGLTAFSQPFSDYAPLYLYALKILTFIPLNSLVSSKLLSLIGDIGIACMAVFFARDLSGARFDGAKLLLIFAGFISVPTLVLNASLWGQSDALYALPILASFYFLLRDRALPASILFGVAISVKVQAIFFAPVLIGYLLRRRETVPLIVLPIAIFCLSVAPAILGGGDPLYWLLIYAKQSTEYPYLSVSAPSVFAFFNGLRLTVLQTDALFWAGIAVAAISAVFVAYRTKISPLTNASAFIALSLFCVLSIPYFLPRMHERYFFLADVFACLYVLFRPGRWYLALLVVGSSLLSYMPYLSSQIPFLAFAQVDLRLPAALLFVSLVLIAGIMYRLRSQTLGVRSETPRYRLHVHQI